MRFSVYAAAACLALLLALSCGGAGGGAGQAPAGGQRISVRYDGREASWEPRDAVFTTFAKGLVLEGADMHDKAGRTQGVVHRIYLANYDLGMTPGRPPAYRQTHAADHLRVEIQLEAASGADELAPPRAGDYAYKSEPHERLSYVFISSHREGRDFSDNLQPSRLRGTVRIEPDGEGRIRGVVDVTDGEGSVAGSFTARRL